MQWPRLRKSRETDNSPQAKRLRRLADKLDELPAKDALRVRQAQELEEEQRKAALELHRRCKALVGTLNGMLEKMILQFTPETLDANRIFAVSETLFQINASGRLVQIVIHSPENGPSTEHFYIPYVLKASIRWFNQDLLDRDQVQENHLFYCVGRGASGWRYFDPRSRRDGPADEEFLAGTLEELL
jgi:hypothetical protein